MTHYYFRQYFQNIKLKYKFSIFRIKYRFKNLSRRVECTIFEVIRVIWNETNLRFEIIFLSVLLATIISSQSIKLADKASSSCHRVVLASLLFTLLRVRMSLLFLPTAIFFFPLDPFFSSVRANCGNLYLTREFKWSRATGE